MPAQSVLAEHSIALIVGIDQTVDQLVGDGAWSGADAEFARPGLIGAVVALGLHRLGVDMSKADHTDSSDPNYSMMLSFNEALLAQLERHSASIPQIERLRSMIDEESYSLSFLMRRVDDPPARQRLTFVHNVARDLTEHVFGDEPDVPDACSPKRRQLAMMLHHAHAKILEVS